MIGDWPNPAAGISVFCKVHTPSVVEKLPRLMVNFKSSICAADHVDAFWDLNITPA